MYVRGMTNPSKGSTAPRADRKRMDRDHLRDQPAEVKLIKLADRLANLGDIGSMDKGFQRLYASESQLLLDEALRGVHPGLESELQEAIAKAGG